MLKINRHVGPEINLKYFKCIKFSKKNQLIQLNLTNIVV